MIYPVCCFCLLPSELNFNLKDNTSEDVFVITDALNVYIKVVPKRFLARGI